MNQLDTYDSTETLNEYPSPDTFVNNKSEDPSEIQPHSHTLNQDYKLLYRNACFLISQLQVANINNTNKISFYVDKVIEREENSRLAHEEFDKYRQAVDRLNEEIQLKDKALNESENEKIDLKRELSVVQTRLEESEHKSDIQSRDIKRLTERIALFTEKYISKEQISDQSNTEKEQMMSYIDSLERKTSFLNTQFQALCVERDSLSSQLQESQRTVTRLTNQLGQQIHENQISKFKINELQSSIDTLVSENDRKTESMTDELNLFQRQTQPITDFLVERIKTLEEDLKQSHQSQESLQNTLSALEQKLSNMKSQELTQLERHESISRRLDEVEKSNSILSVLVDEAQGMLDEVGRIINDMPTLLSQTNSPSSRYETVRELAFLLKQKTFECIAKSTENIAKSTEKEQVPNDNSLGLVTPTLPKSILKKRTIRVKSILKNGASELSQGGDAGKSPKMVTFQPSVKPSELVISKKAYAFHQLSTLFLVCFVFFLVLPSAFSVAIYGKLPWLFMNMFWFMSIACGLVLSRYPKGL